MCSLDLVVVSWAVSISAINCLQRLVSKMTSYVLSRMLSASCLINSSAFWRTPRIWNFIFVYLYGCVRLLTTLYLWKIPLPLI